MKTRSIFSVAAVSVLALSFASIATARGGNIEGKLKKLDTNQDGVIAQSELVSQRREVFQKLDADGNGSVTQAEMKAAHEAKRAERRDPAARWQKMLKRFDANQDGTISRAEAAEMPEKRFNKLDQDSDGQITETEAAAAAKARAAGGGKKGKRGGKAKKGESQQRSGENLFAKLDIDQDGTLSVQEFSAAPLRLMRLDTNQDGNIDKAELQAAKNNQGKRRSKRSHGKSGQNKSGE